MRIERFPVRVYFEDTDAGNIVYHARYLHFFERARTEYLRQLRFSQQQLIKDFDLAFVVKKMDIDFILPAHLDDALEVETEITEIRNASIFFHQRLLRENTIICTTKVIIACVSLSKMKPVLLPKMIKDTLTNFHCN